VRREREWEEEEKEEEEGHLDWGYIVCRHLIAEAIRDSFLSK